MSKKRDCVHESYTTVKALSIELYIYCPTFLTLCFLIGGGTVVKVLCYKSEGLWFDSRWCHWIIEDMKNTLTYRKQSMYLNPKKYFSHRLGYNGIPTTHFCFEFQASFHIKQRIL
jgi:hypothetical protein